MFIRIKRLLSAKNFMGLKILGGLAGVAAVTAIGLLAGGRSSPDNQKKSIDVTVESAEEIVQNTQTEKSLEVNISVRDNTSEETADNEIISTDKLSEETADGTLNNYSIIKLTGQSCRIDIFREALKEFVPGKCIEFKQHSSDNASIIELKLACVKGAIQYVNARKIGFTDVKLNYSMPMIPYSVTAYTHENEEVQLICSLDKVVTAGYISRNRDIRQLELILKDGYGREKFRYNYRNELEQYQPVTYRDIERSYRGYIFQEDTDNITDREVKFFVFATADQWGFYVVPVTRTGTQLYIGREEFFAFENDIWEVDFFDGTK